VFAGLVALEFALALVLVAGAGLLAASYRQLVAVDTGVTLAPQVGVADVVLPLTPAWQPNEARRRFFDELGQRLDATAGIERAGFASRLPLGRASGGIVLRPSGRDDVTALAIMLVASPGYFRTVGSRHLAGRTFDRGDADGAPPVVVLNDITATALFGGAAEAVGQTITYRFITKPVTATVVGVVGAVRYGGLTSELRPEFYLPIAQAVVVPMSLVYRTQGDPGAVVSAVRRTVAAADPTGTVALDNVSTLAARVSAVAARPRFFLVLVGAFAVQAFLLAACGIYGTTAYWVSERWRESGVRLALGARPSAIVRMFVGRGIVVAGLGVAAGLSAAWLAGGLIEHLLFGVHAADAATLASSGLVLIGVALVACWLPARRAGRIDPAETLRSD
jgi:predicted permease